MDTLTQMDDTEDGNAHLREQLAGHLQWLRRQLPFFEPVGSGELSPLNLKAFAELAVACEIMEDASTSGTAFVPNDDLDALWSFTLDRALGPDLWQLAKRFPVQWFLVSLPYLAVRNGRRRSQPFDAVVQWVLRRGLADSFETVPYRVLDQAYFLARAGLYRGAPNWESLYRETFLGRAGDPLYINVDTAYSVTHTVFYLTDFGRCRSPVAQLYGEDVANLLASLVVQYWRDGHWDLMAEMLLCWAALSLPMRPAIAGAQRLLRELAGTDGAVPAQRDTPDADKDSFAERYHTTLVSCIYCTTLLRRSTEHGAVEGREDALC